MSSVSRFIKQVPVSTTYYNVNSNILAGTGVYEFVPSSMGSYPPGYMIAASAQTISILTAQGSASTCVLRDMGKTIFAPYAALSGPSGYYRQVQMLKPSVTATFGVLGDVNVPDAHTEFMTFYLAVPVAGILGGTLSGVLPIAGGQM
jgi:hypothetical protein